MSPRRFPRGALVGIILLTAACGEGQATSQNAKGTPTPYNYKAPTWVDDVSGTSFLGDTIEVPKVSCKVLPGQSVPDAPIPCTVEGIAQFHLAGGVKWSDGNPLDAEGSTYSIDRPLDPCAHSPCPEGGEAVVFGDTFMTLVDQHIRTSLEKRFADFAMTISDPDNSNGSQSGQNQIYLNLCPRISPTYTGPDWARYCGTVIEPPIFEKFTCEDANGACDEVTLTAHTPQMSVDRQTMLPRIRWSDLHPVPEVNIRLLQRMLRQATSRVVTRISHSPSSA